MGFFSAENFGASSSQLFACRNADRHETKSLQGVCIELALSGGQSHMVLLGQSSPGQKVAGGPAGSV